MKRKNEEALILLSLSLRTQIKIEMSRTPPLSVEEQKIIQAYSKEGMTVKRSKSKRISLPRPYTNFLTAVLFAGRLQIVNKPINTVSSSSVHLMVRKGRAWLFSVRVLREQFDLYITAQRVQQQFYSDPDLSYLQMR